MRKWKIRNGDSDKNETGRVKKSAWKQKTVTELKSQWRH